MKKLKENKKRIYILIGLVMVLIIILVLFLNKKDISIGRSSNSLKCSRENTLLEGFHNKEEVIIYLKSAKVNRIKLDRNITLSDKYSEEETYLNTLNTSFENAYNELSGVKIRKTKKSVQVLLAIKEKGIVLDNLSIKRNSEVEDTSLRFDTINDLNGENGIKIGESSRGLKEKLSSMGYTCKD